VATKCFWAWALAVAEYSWPSLMSSSDKCVVAVTEVEDGGLRK
jgi:hypothetical protein